VLAIKNKSLSNAKIISRSEHHISRKNIDPRAIKVLYRLKSCGYDAYLVGGCVRDLLLGHSPKDFDIVTNAKPEEIKKIFRNCRLIGRRFRLAHIIFGKNEFIEVATFRSHYADDNNQDNLTQHGLVIRDNVYGTIEEDAWRRDFTINALYYNIADFSIVDFMEGVKDLHNKQLRIIGQAKKRYQEDPVRMIRAIRIASKLNMEITPDTAAPIKKMVELLYQISSSRLFDEVIKLFHTGHASQAFPALRKYDLFAILFPDTEAYLTSEEGGHFINMLEKAFVETDLRVNLDKSVSPAFLFALLLWPAIEREINHLQKTKNIPPMTALAQAVRTVLHNQNKITAIPRRLSASIHEIWYLQYRLIKKQEKTIYRCLNNSRFRAGFDLLALRALVTPDLQDSVDWWALFQTSNSKQREQLIEEQNQKKSK